MWVWFREFSTCKSIAWIIFFVITGNFGTGLYVLKVAIQSKDDPATFFLGRRTVNQMNKDTKQFQML
jgi:hypothetical protein